MKAGWLNRDFTVKFYSGRVCWGTSQASHKQAMNQWTVWMGGGGGGGGNTPDIMYIQFPTDTCIALYCLVILPLSDTWLMHIYYQLEGPVQIAQLPLL